MTADELDVLRTPLCDRLSMNGAGNIAGLLTEVLPAATVVQRMAAEAAARLTAG